MHAFIRFLAIPLLCLLATAAAGQAIPNHVDPSARETVPNLTALPSLRFLTTPDYPPFNYRDKAGELIGFNIDLARSLCTELKITCTIQAWPWEQAPKALADNQGDALIAGLAITPENAAQFDFTNIYLAFPARFVTQAADAKSFDPARLGAARVSVRKGSTHEEFMRRYLPQATLVGFDTEFAALDAVKAGSAAAYFGDALRASFWLNDNPGCCGFAGEPYFRPDLFGRGLAIAVLAGKDNVRLALDYGLSRLEQSGAFDQLYLRWFPVSFY
jgi:polar amino acid transport system substrate-binding protein